MNGFNTWNVGKIRRRWIQVLAMGRTFVLLTLGSFVFFILLGMAGMAEKNVNSSPVSSMNGFAASLSSRFFIEMVGMELPVTMEGSRTTSAFTGKNMTNFVVQLLTNVNPSDPKSLVAREIPGLGADNPIALRVGTGNESVVAPEDYNLAAGDGDEPIDPTNPNGQGTDPKNTDDSTGEVDPPSKDGSNNSTKEGSSDKIETHKAVMIYHSHPFESYNPLLGKNVSNPNSSSETKNVGLVGDMISKRLEKQGIGTLHSIENYASTVKGYSYNYSYKYSRKTVTEAIAQHNELEYFIDIHRDSQGHAKTTTTIEDLDYAQVYFIIGHANANWRKNEAFAEAIHTRLEKKYPGISRGVWGKTSAQGNGEYNQSVSPNSVLIEIGGIDSTKAELQRTSTVLADIIAEVYWESQAAEKTGAKQTSKNK